MTAIIVYIKANGSCGVLSGNHTRHALQRCANMHGFEKVASLRIHFIVLGEVLGHPDMVEVAKKIVHICNGGRKCLKMTWVEKFDVLPDNNENKLRDRF
eukprot:g10416.t1